MWTRRISRIKRRSNNRRKRKGRGEISCGGGETGGRESLDGGGEGGEKIINLDINYQTLITPISQPLKE